MIWQRNDDRLTGAHHSPQGNTAVLSLYFSSGLAHRGSTGSYVPSSIYILRVPLVGSAYRALLFLVTCHVIHWWDVFHHCTPIGSAGGGVSTVGFLIQYRIGLSTSYYFTYFRLQWLSHRKMIWGALCCHVRNLGAKSMNIDFFVLKICI